MPDQMSHHASAQAAADQRVVDRAPPGALPPLPDAQPHPPNTSQVEVASQRKAVPQSVTIVLVAIGCVAAGVIAYTVTPARALWVETIGAAPIVLKSLEGDIEPVTPPPTPVTTRTETTPETPAQAPAMAEPATTTASTPTAYPVVPTPVTPASSSESDSGTAHTDPAVIDVGEPTSASTDPTFIDVGEPTSNTAQAHVTHRPETGQAAQNHALRLATLEQDTRATEDKLVALQQAYQALSAAVFRVQSSVETLASNASPTASRSAPTAAARQPHDTPVHRVAPPAPPIKPPTLIALKAIAGTRVATLRHGLAIVRLRQGQSVNGWFIKHIDIGARRVALVREDKEQVLTL